MDPAELVFPLVPRGRLSGLPFGGLASVRRGRGSDVAGSRLYRPGDDMGLIDWPSSARLSAARGSDVFVVREHFAEEAPRVVVVVDRRPAMALYPPGLPFLRKPEVVRAATAMIAASTESARGLLGYMDFGDVLNPDPAARDPEPFWLSPRTDHDTWQVAERDEGAGHFHAPEDNVARAFDYLVRLRGALPAGSFVFVLSDFVAGPGDESWLIALEHRWDVVPVIVQDPVWEQSFPEVSGLVLPVADPVDGSVVVARLTRAEVSDRREANEARLGGLIAELASLGLEPILAGTSDPLALHRLFTSWAEERLHAGGHA
jgi:hypothetical protein